MRRRLQWARREGGGKGRRKERKGKAEGEPQPPKYIQATGRGGAIGVAARARRVQNGLGLHSEIGHWLPAVGTTGAYVVHLTCHMHMHMRAAEGGLRGSALRRRPHLPLPRGPCPSVPPPLPPPGEAGSRKQEEAGSRKKHRAKIAESGKNKQQTTQYIILQIGHWVPSPLPLPLPRPRPRGRPPPSVVRRRCRYPRACVCVCRSSL
jgi:hypothetical protein